MDEVGSIAEPTSSLAWADVILADFQRVISRYVLNINTCLSSKAARGLRGLRTIFIQKSKLKSAYFPRKIIAVWIDWFWVRYDWWRWLQLTSSVSPVCILAVTWPPKINYIIKRQCSWSLYIASATHHPPTPPPPPPPPPTPNFLYQIIITLQMTVSPADTM